MITKEQALSDVIRKWVLGDHPFAFDAEAGRCLYNPALSGGCAIGQYLGERYEPAFDVRGALGSVMDVVGDLFEDSHSLFWVDLQKIHDNLAFMAQPVRAGMTGTSAWEDSYTEYMRALQSCVQWG